MTSDNPLLRLADSTELPAFDVIRPEHAEPAIDRILQRNREELAALLAKDTPSEWDALIGPLETIGDRLSRVWSPISHLFSVCSTPEWRGAYNACLPKLTEYGLELSQSKPLYQAYQALADSAAYPSLNAARRKVIDNALRDFRLSGIALPEDQQQRFKTISMRLSEIQTKFEENLLDSTQAWSLLIDDESRLAGMTESARAAARAKAEAKQQQGWLLTLDVPSYIAVVSYADDRTLRETLYRAYVTRASDQSDHGRDHDNAALMEEILSLRHEMATLLGFANYAELSLQAKMAESPDSVEAFLLDLAERARPRAQSELETLRAFAEQRDELSTLEPWDAAYYAEKLKEDSLGLSDEMLRPYFPAPQVIRGMFDLVERLYDIRIEIVDDQPVWHDSVTVYALKTTDGDRFGLFYLDPYAREAKRGGAWMDECRGRRITATGLQLPVAYLVGNFAPPLPGKPALLTHDEVTTLFHEFGHGLHHLLTQVDEASVSGIHGVAWDAVELPSQFMENWCYEHESLSLFARHVDTGEALPDALLHKLREARSFQAGMATVRQLEFSLFDLRMHRDYDPAQGGRVPETLAKVRDQVSVMFPPAWNRFPNSFSHIFAGGYAAGYYSYKWAEVLSSDAFGAFEEAREAGQSLINNEVGRRFRDTVLARGGSADAMELFVAFRGRKPSIEALLRQSGLLETQVAA